jgi:hypothetical protein
MMSTEGLSLDVATLLGIGIPDSTPLPEAEAGEIVLRISEGISLIGLRDSAVGRELVCRQDFYEQYDWSRQPLASGLHRLRLPVPNSNRKTFDEQRVLLAESEQVAPVTAVALALLCLEKAGYPDPFDADEDDEAWARCTETADGLRVALYWCIGRLYVDYSWGDASAPCVWLAASRKSS